jgi:membrane associated rhomboid family serine protease
MQFGPGPMTQAVRAIVIANAAIFLLTFFVPVIIQYFGLSPEAVITDLWIWQPVTYLFLHRDILHILFNMLIVWMFGVDLERRWGARGFTEFYFVTGIGAGLCVIAVSLLPWNEARSIYGAITIGASGACYGLLMAWAMVFPTREILLFFLFPVQARYAALIFGAIAFFSGIGGGSPVAHFAHLGGLIIGYLYLKGMRGLRYEFRTLITKWRFARAKRRFNVHSGGKDTKDKWNIH